MSNKVRAMKKIPEEAKQYDLYKVEDWEQIVPKLFAQAGENYVWAFHGKIGAGKTTCIQALCRYLGVKVPVTSPSFSLLHAYDTACYNQVYHGDFYRLRNKEEALDIGLENYLGREEYFFLEWPHVVEEILPRPYCNIAINFLQLESRRVSAWIQE